MSRRCHQYKASGSCTYGASCKYMHVDVPVNDLNNPPPKGHKNKTRLGKRKRPDSDSESTNHLESFFALHEFEYDSGKPATDEFRRMSRSWDKDAREEAREGFKNALVQEFNKMYGTDVNDIGSWQGLCRVLGIAPVPDKLNECREAVEKIHVNLVDLVDRPNNIRVFATEVALSSYTKDSRKIFPKENAYAGGLLRYLLRHIENPNAKRRTKGNRRRK